MWKVILLCTFVGLTAGKKAYFYNYRIYEATPETTFQLNFLHEMNHYSTVDSYFFCRPPTTVGTSAEIVVPLYSRDFIQTCLLQAQINYKVVVDNVQELIDNTTWKGSSSSFDFTSYHTLEKIYENLDDLVKQYPENAEIIVGGKTYEERQIKGIKISFRPNNPGVFLEGGINPREWISPAVVMYITHQLLNSKNAAIRNVVEEYDWYIFPLFNPDGYVYTHTTNRMWSKTRKQYYRCHGSNLNMNWNYLWNTNVFHVDSCFENFDGYKPFSDIEALTMSKYIKSIHNKFSIYFSFHTSQPKFMFVGDKYDQNNSNYTKDYLLALRGSAMALKNNNMFYLPENINDVHETSGNTVNYMKHVYHKLAFGCGLTKNNSEHGFLHPPENIISIGQYIVNALHSILIDKKLIISDIE